MSEGIYVFFITNCYHNKEKVHEGESAYEGWVVINQRLDGVKRCVCNFISQLIIEN
jgi:hypothetical protein